MVCQWWGPRSNDKQEICRIINISHNKGMMHLCLLWIIEPSCYASSEIILSLILAEMLIASNIRPVLKWRVWIAFPFGERKKLMHFIVFTICSTICFRNLSFEFIFKIFILDILIKYNLIQNVYLRIWRIA